MKNLLIKIFTLSLALSILCNFHYSSLSSVATESECEQDFSEKNSDKDFENSDFLQLARLDKHFNFYIKSLRLSGYQKKISDKEAFSSLNTPPPDIC